MKMAMAMECRNFVACACNPSSHGLAVFQVDEGHAGMDEVVVPDHTRRNGADDTWHAQWEGIVDDGQ